MLLFCLQGTVYDKATLMPLQGSKVNVVGTDGSSFSALTDENGAFKFEGNDSGRYINGNVTYAILAEKDGHLVVKDQISTHGISESTTFLKEFFLDSHIIICYGPPTVFFSTNSSRLSLDSDSVIRLTIATLLDNPSVVLEIIGNADRSERESIALKRSEAVRDHLIAAGIHKGRLVATTQGKSSPVIKEASIAKMPNHPERDTARAKNRRVEFKVLRTDWKE
jgi:hypothetical protein